MAYMGVKIMSKVIRVNEQMQYAINEYRNSLIYQNQNSDSCVKDHIENILEELTDQQVIMYALIYALNN